MMITTQELDASTTLIAQTGPTIAPVAPASFSVTPIPGKRPGWLFETSGTMDPAKAKYPGVLFSPGAAGKSVPLPIPPNTGYLALCFDLWQSASMQAAANARETDVLVVRDGLKFNLSGQVVIPTGAIEIGNWTDTQLRAFPLSPNRRHKIKWTYSITPTACSVLSYEQDGSVYQVPAKYGGMAATPCNWLPGAYIQIQLGSLPAGLPWSQRLGRIRLKWW
jgi:hypothetical protein